MGARHAHMPVHGAQLADVWPLPSMCVQAAPRVYGCICVLRIVTWEHWAGCSLWSFPKTKKDCLTVLCTLLYSA